MSQDFASLPPQKPASAASSGLNVSAWCIQNPLPAIMLFVLLTCAGFLSFHAMKVQNFPDLDLPTITVAATLQGASPSQMETDVARRVENIVATLQGVKHIYTKVSDSSAILTIEFRLEKPVQEALDDVRSAVSRIRSDLPADMDDPVISKLDLAGSPILAFTVASPRRDAEALSWLVDDEITRVLLGVSGVGAVDRVGGVSREITVAVDPLRLQALGLTAAEVSRQVRQVRQETAGGRADLAGSEQPLRTTVLAASVDEVRALQVVTSRGKALRLDEVAVVEDGHAEVRSAAFLNGQPVIGFEVTRSRGASEIDVGAGVARALAQLKTRLPDVQVDEAFNFVEPVADEYHGSMSLLYEGAILAVLVVWAFLKNLRATFIAAVALPLSVIPAFWGMDLFGFSLNVVTFLALSLVIGILVDDAIVEIENIVRHQHMGKSAWQAAIEAADEIGLAVIATTFTLIAVFLPTAFMSGIAGRFFKQFGWTAVLAVFASLVVARMLTPMMAAWLLKDDRHQEPPPGRVMSAYMRMVFWSLSHRWLTLLATIVFFISSLALIPLLPQGFMPPDDTPETQIQIELPPGTPLARTVAAAEEVRQRILPIAHIRSVYTTVGAGKVGSDPFAPAGAAQVRKASLTLMLDRRGDRPMRKQVIENQIREALADMPGVRTKVGLGGSGEKYVLVLSGDDPISLAQAARAVERDLRQVPGVGGISSGASLVRPEVSIRPDPARAADLGVTTAAIGETLRVATVGDYSQGLAKMDLARRQVPILVRLQDAAKQDLQVLADLAVPSSKALALGEVVRLGAVADLSLSSGPAEINRYDRRRNITLEVELSGVPLGDLLTAMEAFPSIRNLPSGVERINVGDAEVMEELFTSFGLAMLTGIVCILLVLILLFKDVIQPLTILAALPLSLGGAFVALLLANKSFSMPSLIGLIMMMGIATKNSILLVEYAIVARRDHGLSRQDALMDACRKRARPIIMTTIAMGAGMMPTALGFGAADTSFRSPMAVAVIGGLLTSTFLSLLVIPVVFSVMDDLKNALWRLWRRDPL